MKRFIFVIASVLSLSWSANAQLEYRKTAFTSALPSGQTNSFTVDTRNTSGLALQVAFTGAAANTTTAIIGVTNAVNAATPQTVTIALNGTNYVYSWAAVPVLLATNYSLPVTNITIGVTNAAITASTNNTLNVSINNRTNTFVWAANRSKPSYISTNCGTASGTAAEATNLYNTLSSFYPTHTIAVAGSLVTIALNVGDSQLWVSNTIAGTTNLLGSYFTATNIVATNSMQLQTTNDVGWAATNIYIRLYADFSNSITFTQPSAGVVSLVTSGNPGLTVTESGVWATNLITTNALTGNVYFHASNSLDKVTWFRAASRDFVVPFNSTSQATAYTNFTDIFAAGWWAWSVENAATNYANANAIRILAAVKQGL